jgi:hypothetical protein
LGTSTAKLNSNASSLHDSHTPTLRLPVTDGDASPAAELRTAALQLLAAACSNRKVCAVLASEQHQAAWAALADGIRSCLQPAQGMPGVAKGRVVRAALSVLASLAHAEGAPLLECLLENEVTLYVHGRVASTDIQGDGHVSAEDTLVYRIVMAIKDATMVSESLTTICKEGMRGALLGPQQSPVKPQLRTTAADNENVASNVENAPNVGSKRPLSSKQSCSTISPAVVAILSDMTRLSAGHDQLLPPSHALAEARSALWERLGVAAEGFLLLRMLAFLKTSATDSRLARVGASVVHSIFQHRLCVLALHAAIANVDAMENGQPFMSGSGSALAAWAIDFLATADICSATLPPQQLLVDMPLLHRSAASWSKQLAHNRIDANQPAPQP